jgi:hypothetical protein
MSPFGQLAPIGPVTPVAAAWNSVARFDNYDDAQRAVDTLSDNGFPVEHLDIVGTDLQLIERVTGRLTRGRAAAAGAMSGLWMGLLLGVLFGLFTTGHRWLAVVGLGLLFGALWGAVFGFVAHSATGGRRDFSSVRSLVARQYEVIARDGTVDRARSLLGVTVPDQQWPQQPIQPAAQQPV